jgi:4-amino-4-deoxy-L-arabinose transferase-like glycosyltransferase
MARELLSGQLPYVGMWDNKPVGIYLAFALAQLALGLGLGGIRLLYAGAIFLTTIGIYRIGADALRSRRIGIGAAALYPAFTGNNDNAEVFVLLFLTFGFHQLLAALPTSPGRAPHWGRLVTSGLLLGLAAQFKYSAVLEIGFVSLAAALATGWIISVRPVGTLALLLALGVTVALPTLLVMTIYAAANHLQDFLYANFVAPLFYVSQTAEVTPGRAILHAAYGVAPLALLGFAGLAFLLHQAWRRTFAPRLPALLVLSGWMAGSALSIAASGRYFQHYFLLVVPPAALAVASLLEAFLPAWKRRGRGVAALAVAVTILVGPPVLHYVQEARWIAHAGTTPDDYRNLARTIRMGLVPGDRIYVVNDNPMLYVLSGAAIPTRYAWPWHVLRDDFGVAVNADQEIAAIFARTPRFIVLREADAAYPNLESDRRLALIRRAMNGRYRPVKTMGGLTLFVRYVSLAQES